MSLHKTHICVVKSLVKIAAVSWHSLRRFIKPAPVHQAQASEGLYARCELWTFCLCHAAESDPEPGVEGGGGGLFRGGEMPLQCMGQAGYSPGKF